MLDVQCTFALTWREPVTDERFPNVTIARWQDLASDHARLLPALDAIFFASSATQTFASDEARALFRERWLGRYLMHFPEWAYVALAPDGTPAGYLVGSLADPAETPLFGDLKHFAAWRDLTRRFPAQLHVNLDERWRGQGIGRALIEAFLRDARRAGAPGVHVVTARGLRNVGFYLSAGFKEAGALPQSGGRELLFLAQSLR